MRTDDKASKCTVILATLMLGFSASSSGSAPATQGGNELDCVSTCTAETTNSAPPADWTVEWLDTEDGRGTLNCLHCTYCRSVLSYAYAGTSGTGTLLNTLAWNGTSWVPVAQAEITAAGNILLRTTCDGDPLSYVFQAEGGTFTAQLTCPCQI